MKIGARRVGMATFYHGTNGFADSADAWRSPRRGRSLDAVAPDVRNLSSAAGRRARQRLAKRPELGHQPKSFQPACADEFLKESIQSVLEEVWRLGQSQRSRTSPVWMGLGELARSFVQLALVRSNSRCRLRQRLFRLCRCDD